MWLFFCPRNGSALEMALPDSFLNPLIQYHHPVKSMINSDIYPLVNDIALNWFSSRKYDRWFQWYLVKKTASLNFSYSFRWLPINKSRLLCQLPCWFTNTVTALWYIAKLYIGFHACILFYLSSLVVLALTPEIKGDYFRSITCF